MIIDNLSLSQTWAITMEFREQIHRLGGCPTLSKRKRGSNLSWKETEKHAF